jgi:hypothetical protein
MRLIAEGQQTQHFLGPFVCAPLETRGYPRWFVEAIKEIHDSPRQNLREYLLRRGWPDDTTFVARLQMFPRTAARAASAGSF